MSHAKARRRKGRRKEIPLSPLCVFLCAFAPLRENCSVFRCKLGLIPNLHSILPFVFGLVQCAIRSRHDLFRRINTLRKRRDTDTHSYAAEWLRLSVWKAPRSDTLPDALGNRSGLFDTRLWQQHTKLLAPVTQRHVGGTKLPFQAVSSHL